MPRLRRWLTTCTAVAALPTPGRSSTALFAAILFAAWWPGSVPRFLAVLRAASQQTTSGPAEDTESIIPPLSVRTMGGERRVLRFSSDRRPTVLYFVSASCIWCAQNALRVKQLARLKETRYRFIAVSLSRAVAQHMEQLGFEVVFSPNADRFRPYGIQGTPYTLVVSPEGNILRGWPGAYIGSVCESITRFFQASIACSPN
jgi:hypothetical protein